VNQYGEMTDEINAGLESDRMETTWILRDERVERLAAGEKLPPVTDSYPEEAFLVRSEDARPLVNPSPPDDAPWYFVEIPYNIGHIKKTGIDRARGWQMALRQTLPKAFERGYVAVDFVTSDGRCWYVLRGSQGYSVCEGRVPQELAPLDARQGI
jgi:predicted GNAT superfamily acetyltransferase